MNTTRHTTRSDNVLCPDLRHRLCRNANLRVAMRHSVRAYYSTELTSQTRLLSRSHVHSEYKTNNHSS
jgi:hypothetical protein